MVNEKNASTEQRILVAAKNVFIARGRDGARMQDIADQAGINKALLHYYFRSKDTLFEMIFQDAMKELVPRVTAIMNDPGTSLFYKIEKFCSEYIGLMLENPFIPLFVMSEIQRHPGELLNKLWGNKKPSVSLVIDQITEDMRVGRIRQTDPQQLLLNVISLCIFPFAGRPMWQFITGMSDDHFMQLVNERKKSVPRFIIQSIMT